MVRVMRDLKEEFEKIKTFIEFRPRKIGVTAAVCIGAVLSTKYYPDPNVLTSTYRKCSENLGDLLDEYFEFRKNPCEIIDYERLKKDPVYRKKIKKQLIFRGC
jgi:hypothetical protein